MRFRYQADFEVTKVVPYDSIWLSEGSSVWMSIVTISWTRLEGWNDLVLNSQLLRQGYDYISIPCIPVHRFLSTGSSEHMLYINSEEGATWDKRTCFCPCNSLKGPEFQASESLLPVLTIMSKWYRGGESDNHNTSPNLGNKPGFNKVICNIST